jgi:hypothetical protein
MGTAAGLVEVPLGTFCGINLEMSPTDLAQGLSPDCRNVAFIPGSVFTRPSLKNYISLGNNHQVVYATSYVKPDGTVVQFVCDSAGQMFADGALIGTTQAGNRFKTIQEFNRLYIAISDGEHGADVPLQYDGISLDRVSQDGPGAPPTLGNQALVPVQLVTGTSGSPVAVTTAIPQDPQQVQVGNGSDDGGAYNPPQYETYYTSILYTTSTPHGLSAGSIVSISGNTLYNYASAFVSSVPTATTFILSAYTPINTTGTGGNVTLSAPLLIRSGNQVSAYTATPHGIRIGYRVRIDGVADATKSISTIVIDNDTFANIATITTTSDHGLVPGNTFTLTDVPPESLTLTNYDTSDGSTTVTTSTAHNLQPGDLVNVALGPAGVLIQFAVQAVPTATTFTFINPRPDAAGTTGIVQVPWIPASGATFTVASVPTPDTFQIAVSQGNGTWSGGTINFPWNGEFYVTSVKSATSFTYQQNGPNDLVYTGTGTVTPIGQIAPGNRNVVCIFQTRTGYTTAPSPTVQFTASGGEYALVTNIPIGPSNVVARIIAFTGANGGNYFYLPVAPQSNGTFIGTSTVVNDNTTTSAVFDFTDQALLSATAIDIPGNNLFRQVVLGPVLSFHSYGSRLFPFGEWNKVQQFINMGFEGGIYSTAPTIPLGWTIGGAGALTTLGDYGLAWRFDATGSAAAISQTAFRNKNGVAIIQPQTNYTFRAWVRGTVTAELYSLTSGVLATATVTATGNFTNHVFSAKTPVVMPPDTVFRVYAQTGGAVVDELEVVYTDNLYLKPARASYLNNPEAFDGVSGVIGPANDANEIRAMFERKDVLHFLTYGPEGALYETTQTASGEPSTWNVQHVASKCGAISVWGEAKFEDWEVWASDTGLRLYNGGDVEKMSQEIQPWWDTINPEAKQFSFLANDPYERRIYFGAPTGTVATVNSMYVLDYRELNTAAALANSTPLRIGLGGKVFTSDLTRKWTPWDMTVNFAGLLQGDGKAFMAFSCGQGTVLGAASFGRVYSLREGQVDGLDDDYGAFSTRYTTYYFVSQEEAQMLKLGTHRKFYAFLSAYITGAGSVQWTPLIDRNERQATKPRAVTLQAVQNFDFEFGLEVQGERVAFQLNTLAPNSLGQQGFSLNNLVIGMNTDVHSPVRGWNG